MSSSVAGAMALMAVASFSSDLTMPISWNTCVEIGKEYTATVSSTMNMLGNFAGFVAPVVFGFILQYTHANYAIVMYTMAVAAIVSGALLVLPGTGRPALNFFKKGLVT